VTNTPAPLPSDLAAAHAAKVPPVAHPLVRVHPVTGRRSLYISMCYMTHVEGMSIDDSRTLFAELAEFATQDRFVYRHRWTDHDILMWDNRCTMHVVTPFDAGRYRRVMHRTAIAGDAPVIPG
jgi:alpha-ketoglutarate-dependent taurine dioxygenase